MVSRRRKLVAHALCLTAMFGYDVRERRLIAERVLVAPL
jgi:hypothetical protein